MVRLLTEGELSIPARLAGIAMAAAIAVPFGRLLWTSLASRRWRAVEATIETSEVTESTDSEWYEIRYRYTVDDRSYTGRRVDFGMPLGYRLFDGPGQVTGRYRPGSTVRAHYDPRHPAQSVLEPGPRVVTVVLFATSAAVTILLAGSWLIG